MKPDRTIWKVTAQIFSGRKNPEWTLNVQQQKNWMALWKQAALSNTEVQVPAVLGYTGCRLQYNEHSHWQLFNGVVSFYEHDSIFSKKDEERQMEQFLLNTAAGDVKETLQQVKIT